ncbi:MAG: HPr family phosphocarrier protein [Candidatus Omnitrophica bacterium]|nr:HPr family phosphocarrier protein [Candidatus Omnitrophota bacterium]MCM8826350.1 HPr family phosphocarrier protein [Candidatus Omnitrophota bacterium]
MSKLIEEVVVNNNEGLHARPAALFVQIANKFDSSVKIEKDGLIVDGKSIIALLSLGLTKGTKIKLILEGEDASQAFSELKEFLVKEDD